MSAPTATPTPTLVNDRNDILQTVNSWLSRPLDTHDGDLVLDPTSPFRENRASYRRTSTLSLEHRADLVVTTFTLQMQWESVCAPKPGATTSTLNDLVSMQLLDIKLQAMPRRADPFALRQLNTPTMVAIRTTPAHLREVHETSVQTPYIEPVGRWSRFNNWQKPAPDDRAVTWRWNVPEHLVTSGLRLELLP